MVRLLGQTDAPSGGGACMPCVSVAGGQSLMFGDGTGDLGQKVRASNLVQRRPSSPLVSRPLSEKAAGSPGKGCTVLPW